MAISKPFYCIFLNAFNIMYVLINYYIHTVQFFSRSEITLEMEKEESVLLGESKFSCGIFCQYNSLQCITVDP